MHEQRATVNSVYEKKTTQNELMRKVWELRSSVSVRLTTIIRADYVDVDVCEALICKKALSVKKYRALISKMNEWMNDVFINVW